MFVNRYLTTIDTLKNRDNSRSFRKVLTRVADVTSLVPTLTRPLSTEQMKEVRVERQRIFLKLNFFCKGNRIEIMRSLKGITWRAESICLFLHDVITAILDDSNMAARP